MRETRIPTRCREDGSETSPGEVDGFGWRGSGGQYARRVGRVHGAVLARPQHTSVKQVRCVTCFSNIGREGGGGESDDPARENIREGCAIESRAREITRYEDRICQVGEVHRCAV